MFLQYAGEDPDHRNELYWAVNATILNPSQQVIGR